VNFLQILPGDLIFFNSMISWLVVSKEFREYQDPVIQCVRLIGERITFLEYYLTAQKFDEKVIIIRNGVKIHGNR